MTKPAALVSVVTLVLLITATSAIAALTSCPEHYWKGQAPDIVNLKLSNQTREICYSGYGILHSGVTRTPVYSAEHLTRDRLTQARTMRRKSAFFADPHLPRSERAELRYYQRSGYDRGHVAPSGDMPDERSQQESFSLANMVPQDPRNNRGIWEGIESVVRKLTEERGELYVITGPVYRDATLRRIGGTVYVPSQLFKAVYDPRRNEAAAYLVDNIGGASAAKVSIAELERIIGMSLFPKRDTHHLLRLLSLPEPKPFRERRHLRDS